MTVEVPDESGIYIVTIKSTVPMPVTRDTRYVDICARVNNQNVKVGKAKNLRGRQKNYWSDFDQDNVVFMPVVTLTEIQIAEFLIKKALNSYRLRSPNGGKLEWLAGITAVEARQVVLDVLARSDLTYQLL